MVRKALAPEIDDETRALWDAFLATRDTEARNRLIEFHLSWCRTVARTLYAKRGGLHAEFLDYVQLATLGLIGAIDRFNPGRGVCFEAYALPRVRGAILNGLHSLSEKHEQVSLRKRLQQQRLKSLRADESYNPGQVPNADLFTELAGVAVGFAIGYMLEGTAMMLDENSIPPPRKEFYDSVEMKEQREAIRKLVDALPMQDRRVVQYHYYQGLSFTEVADLLGLTKGRISQIHRQAVERIREMAQNKSLTLNV